MAQRELAGSRRSPSGQGWAVLRRPSTGKPDIWSQGPKPGDASGVIGNWGLVVQGVGQ